MNERWKFTATPIPVVINLTPAQMAEAEEVGRNRQQLAERLGYKANGYGSVLTHTRGRYGEQALASYLGTQVDPDWTWLADKRRGCDVLGPDGSKWHSRTDRSAMHFIWRDEKDERTGMWVFADVRCAPEVWLIGCLPGELCARRAVGGRIWDIDLQPVPKVPQIDYGVAFDMLVA